MPKLRLTAAAVERFQPPSKGQVDYYDTHLPAFGLRISYSGTKAWFVMTRVGGKLTRLTLGRHPALCLAAARDKARSAIENARSGGDPRQVEAERRRQQARVRQTTFAHCAALFLERHVDRNLRPNTAREYRRILLGPDTIAWQDWPISRIKKNDVLDVLHRIDSRGAPAASNRALAYLSKFFAWCVDAEHVAASPAERVRAISQPRSRERVLSREELVWLWRALGNMPGPFAPMIKVLLLTGQRRGEVAGMQWNEVRELGTTRAIWELPGDRTKNGQPHMVPLPNAVCEILNGLPRTGPFVFQGRITSAFSGFSKAKRQVDDEISVIRSRADLLPLSPWTLHDLRRTMVTVMNEELGIAPHVVEAVVNHVSGAAKRGVAGVYNRALYSLERRAALTQWSDWLLIAKQGAR